MAQHGRGRGGGGRQRGLGRAAPHACWPRFLSVRRAPPAPSAASQSEQLRHWQQNRRKLAFSTVGTPDYIAPGACAARGGASGQPELAPPACQALHPAALPAGAQTRLPTPHPLAYTLGAAGAPRGYVLLNVRAREPVRRRGAD